MNPFRQFLPIAIPAVVVAAVSGCALLMPTGRDYDKDRLETPDPSRRQVTRDALQLRVALIDRPYNDPLPSRILWDDVDESGVLDPRVRETLNQNGFKIGVAGSTPPRSLQSLLEIASLPMNPTDTTVPELGRLSNRPPITLLAGGNTIIETNSGFESCSVVEFNGDEESSRDYRNARFVFRVRARRLQDGWARLEFLPEIHHGSNTTRHVPNELGWQLQTAQNIQPLYNEKFEITLNRGEIAVVSSVEADPRSAGYHFFVGSTDMSSQRRLLVIRLADVSTIEGVAQNNTTEPYSN